LLIFDCQACADFLTFSSNSKAIATLFLFFSSNSFLAAIFNSSFSEAVSFNTLGFYFLAVAFWQRSLIAAPTLPMLRGGSVATAQALLAQASLLLVG